MHNYPMILKYFQDSVGISWQSESSLCSLSWKSVPLCCPVGLALGNCSLLSPQGDLIGLSVRQLYPPKHRLSIRGPPSPDTGQSRVPMALEIRMAFGE